MTLVASVPREVDFLDLLTNELMDKGNYEFERLYLDPGADLIVKDRASGKVIAIEFKNAGNYGELPISTILPISRMVKQADHLAKFFLITFSKVPVLLENKLKELNVKTLSLPTISEVVNEVQQAFTS
jgi:hypothetical protein